MGVFNHRIFESFAEFVHGMTELRTWLPKLYAVCCYMSYGRFAYYWALVYKDIKLNGVAPVRSSPKGEGFSPGLFN
jgi:hypothetical protein